MLVLVIILPVLLLTLPLPVPQASPFLRWKMLAYGTGSAAVGRFSYWYWC